MKNKPVVFYPHYKNKPFKLDVSEPVKMVLDSFFGRYWAGAYITECTLETSTKKIKSISNRMELSLVYRDETNGVIQPFLFVPTQMAIQSTQGTSDLTVHYQICKGCNKPHIHLGYVETANWGELKRVGKLTRLLGNGYQGVYSKSGRSRQTLYDQAYLMSIDHDRRKAFTWMNKQLKKDGKSVEWETFKQAMKRRRRENEIE